MLAMATNPLSTMQRYLPTSIKVICSDIVPVISKTRCYQERRNRFLLAFGRKSVKVSGSWERREHHIYLLQKEDLQGGPPKTAHFWWPLGRPVSTLSTCPVCQINRTLQELRSRGFSARSDNFGAPHKRFCEKVRFLRSFQGTKKCLRIWTKNSLLFDKNSTLYDSLWYF